MSSPIDAESSSCIAVPTKFFLSRLLVVLSKHKKSFCLSSNNEVKFDLHCDKKSTNSEMCMELYLQLLNSSDKKQIIIRYQYSVVKENGDMLKIQCGNENFSSTQRYGGRCHINLQYLRKISNGLSTNDKVKFYCEIEEIENVAEPILKSISLQPQFQALLESGKFSDVVLVVGEKELFAHKNILSARSKVFAGMFEHDCEESRKNRVDIIDMSLDVCERLLCYIYTGTIPQMELYAIELFVVSDKYQLDFLKLICENHLETHIKIETVADVVVLANMLRSNELETKCIDFITENSSQVKDTDGWKVLETKAEVLAKLFLSASNKNDSLNQQINQLRNYCQVVEAPQNIEFQIINRCHCLLRKKYI